MLGHVGQFILILAPLVILFGLFANSYGSIKKSNVWLTVGRRSSLALALLTTTASFILIYLLVTSDFRYEYVVKYTSLDLSMFYKITAFWGGNAGSLLLWLWILSLYTLMVTYSKHKDSERMIPIVTSVLFVISLFFTLVLNFLAQPFALYPEVVNDGNGLNPLLQNPGMAIHPITLYLGYIGVSVPFAYAVAALILKKGDSLWLKITRKWTLVSWCFLSMGIIYGGKWAYEELGWGGYWAWDPVENASFMPWLTATAFLHSAIVQEKKGMFKKWNMSLIFLTFWLTIFGTFLTRSGVLWSVHAFANGPLGAYFLVFVGFIFVFCAGLLIYRWSILKDEIEFEATVSKESSFMMNNLLLLGVTFTIFWGTVYPLISESLTGHKITVGAPWFNWVSLKVFILLIIVMGIGPLIAWRKSNMRNFNRNFLYPFIFAMFSGVTLIIIGIRDFLPLVSIMSALFVLGTVIFEFMRGVDARVQLTGDGYFKSIFELINRNRRRYGGYIVHVAIVIIAIGVTVSSTFTTSKQWLLEPSQQKQIKDFTITYRGMSQAQLKNSLIVYADVVLQKGDKTIGVMRPEQVYYVNGLSSTSEVAIYSHPLEDVYVVLAGWKDGTDHALIEVKWNPLVSWIWVGLYVIVLGTLIALWPDRRRDLIS